MLLQEDSVIARCEKHINIITVEEALRFGGSSSAEEVPVHAIHSKDSGAEIEQLKMMLERMSQRFETFEQQLKGLDTSMATKVEDNMKRKVRSPSGGQYRGNWKKNTRGCFNCGEEGHWKRECPLIIKLQQVSTGGGRGLACKEVIHQDSMFLRNVDKVPLHVYNISSLLRVKGQLEGQHVRCLLDSGAAVSVVQHCWIR